MTTRGRWSPCSLPCRRSGDAGIQLDGDLILTGNCDEEIGGITGLGFLIQEGIVKADFGLQWDGSLTGIGLAAQGRTRFLIRTLGKSYHGQVPILGVNAIEKMSKINVALTDYWRNVLLKRQRPIPGIELPERGSRSRGGQADRHAEHRDDPGRNPGRDGSRQVRGGSASGDGSRGDDRRGEEGIRCRSSRGSRRRTPTCGTRSR